MIFSKYSKFIQAFHLPVPPTYRVDPSLNLLCVFSSSFQLAVRNVQPQRLFLEDKESLVPQMNALGVGGGKSVMSLGPYRPNLKCTDMLCNK